MNLGKEVTSRLKSKAKVSREKATVQPTVINDILMRQYLV